MKFQAIKGMSDILPLEVLKWQHVEEKSRAFFERHLFQEIRTPLLEYTDVFSRSIGEASDIVHKEMYSFEDRGGRSMTLRPEMTASCVRAAIEGHLLTEGDMTKLYYVGPMFRAERPQAGRRRQFHQAGVEVFGSTDPVVDAEVVALLVNYLKCLGLKRLTLKLNNLGCPTCRASYLKTLRADLEEARKHLCADCHYRLGKNILRVFDCKNPTCRKRLDLAPKIFDCACDTCRERFDEVCRFLKLLKTPYIVDKNLVRGLDYYTHTVFEVSCEALGAQDAVAAGGRYDDLVHEFGGPKIGATGFAVGLERLISALEADSAFQKLAEKTKDPLLFLANVEYSALALCLELAEDLRSQGWRVMINELGKSLKAQLRQADKWQARYVIIIGEEEVKTGELTVKDLKKHQEEKVKRERLATYLSKLREGG